MRKVLLAAAAAVVLSTPSTGAAAAGDGFSYTERGLSASAYWESCTADSPRKGTTTCTFTDLFVFQGRERSSGSGPTKGTRVCVFTDTYSYSTRPDGGGGPEAGKVPGDGDYSYDYESGCASVSSSAFSVARDLATASLAPTTVTLTAYSCTYDPTTDTETCDVTGTRDVTVSAEWTAFGELASFSERFKYRLGNCTETYSAKGQRREAVATGTLDGVSLGESLYADIGSGSFTFRSTCGAS